MNMICKFLFLLSNAVTLIRDKSILYLIWLIVPLLSFIALFFFNVIEIFFNYLFNSCIAYCEAPLAWNLYSQDFVSLKMEALVELHDNIMYYLAIILFAVNWVLFLVVKNYVYSKSNDFLNYSLLRWMCFFRNYIYVKYNVFINYSILKRVIIFSWLIFVIINLPYLLCVTHEIFYYLYVVQCDQWDWIYLLSNYKITFTEYDSYLLSSEEGYSSESESEPVSVPDFGTGGSEGGNGSDSGSNSGSDSHACIHGVEGNCGVCLANSHHGTIANCEHSWDILDHQGNEGYTGARCDINNGDVCLNTVTEDGYHCNSCNAVACPNCVEGFEEEPYSETESQKDEDD